MAATNTLGTSGTRDDNYHNYYPPLYTMDMPMPEYPDDSLILSGLYGSLEQPSSHFLGPSDLDVNNSPTSFQPYPTSITDSVESNFTHDIRPSILESWDSCRYYPAYIGCDHDIYSQRVTLTAGPWSQSSQQSAPSATEHPALSHAFPYPTPGWNSTGNQAQLSTQSTFPSSFASISHSSHSQTPSSCPFAPHRLQAPHSGAAHHPAQSSAHSAFRPQPHLTLPPVAYSDNHLATFPDDSPSSPLPPIDTIGVGILPHSSPSSDLPEHPKPLATGEEMSSRPMPSRRRPSRTNPSTSAPGGDLDIVDLTKDESGHVGTRAISQRPCSRNSTHSASLPVPTTRKRRASNEPKAEIEVKKVKSDTVFDAFDDIPEKPSDDEDSAIDLTEATEVPQELLTPKVDTRTKLGGFECVICMDNASALTVTHCGHLFCSECLHSALYTSNTKQTCPVCRTKVDDKDKKTKSAKSFYHLELKVTTRKTMGKRPVKA